MQQAMVQDFFDKATNTFSYVVNDPITKHCAIIDSVLDYDVASATTSTINADHLTAAQYLKSVLGGKIAMSHHIALVQETFSAIYNLDFNQFNVQQPFDYLFDDHEHFYIGELEAYNIPTPGHTPACLSYVTGDAVFVGDTLFMPDYGTARCDFPRGSAGTLFDSVQKLYQLPDTTRVFLCHDYLPTTRDEYSCQTDIYTQKMQNIHINDVTTKAEFVQMRKQRDATLSMPKLILPSIQINMKAGQLPEPEENGVRYLKLPLNFFKA